MTTQEILIRAKQAAPQLRNATEAQKNEYLLAMADALLSHTDAILAANRQDVEAAREHISPVMIDRLTLTEERIAAMAEGIRQVADLPDPVGRVLSETVRPNGLRIEKIAVPLGVVAIIYESRPNVTSDAAALTLKSGNACVLRGGKEAFRSANAVTEALRDGLKRKNADPDLIQLVQDTTRQSANELMTAVGYVDLLIPRGGAGLIRACVENATVPCIQTGTGICHIYVDENADEEQALDIIENATTSRPSVCNAEEVLLVHKAIAPTFLPKIKERLTDRRAAEGKQPVELRLSPEAMKFIEGTPAGEQDFDTEFLDYILAVHVVGNVTCAVDHIAAHSTGHSEAILTRSDENADYFTRNVDSAAVYVNASTRFTDGGEFGLGCEMGISTQKLHARGPMGLEEMTAYKYVIRGNGQTR
ncbi:MAG: glutamate-5-semialdehyde dehydrogenase [Clostridia bacterium]|nr:glutamate-5-semialdehyde dehydrogenase [Clostridia bacterium]